MKMIVRALVPLLTAALMSACGGSDETSAADPYVGTWFRCIPASLPNGFATPVTTAIKKINDSTLEITTVRYSGTSPDCKDLGLSIRPYVSQTYVLTGQKTIGGDVGDKATVAGPNLSFKTLLLIKEGQLFFGDRSTLDAEGFPGAFAFSEPWTPMP